MSGLATFAVEAFIWYAIVIGMIGLRMYSRILLRGDIKARASVTTVTRRRFQLDDWLMAVTFILYTADLVCSSIAAKSLESRSEISAREPQLPSNNSSTGFLTPPPPSKLVDLLGESFTANSSLVQLLLPVSHETKLIASATFGTAMAMVVEQLQSVIVWMLKACLLATHFKVTRNLYWEHFAVKAIATYVALGFVVMEILYFGAWCRPFGDYFPAPGHQVNDQCRYHTNHFILNAILNISSDLAILAVMIPLFARTKMPLRDKLAVCGAFGLGGLVIFWAAFSKAWTLTHSFDVVWLLFFHRETSTALIVANIPIILPMLRKFFGKRRRSQITSSLTGLDSNVPMLHTRPNVTRSESVATALYTISTVLTDLDEEHSPATTSQLMSPLDKDRKTPWIVTCDLSDADSTFRDRTKSACLEEHYHSMMQSQKMYIAPWGEPKEVEDAV